MKYSKETFQWIIIADLTAINHRQINGGNSGVLFIKLPVTVERVCRKVPREGAGEAPSPAKASTGFCGARSEEFNLLVQLRSG